MSEELLRDYIGDPVSFFISYSHKDSKTANEIKNVLEHFGFYVFLAEDIEASKEWFPRIEEELRSCDVFFPILTENFKKSDWTGQEAGAAYSLRKLIISFKIDIAPYGFISKYQALSLNMGNIDDICKKIIKVLGDDKKYIGKLIDSIIGSFSECDKFDEADEKSEILEEFQSNFTDQQVIAIFLIAYCNSQVYLKVGYEKKRHSFVRELGKNRSDMFNKAIDILVKHSENKRHPQNKENFLQFFDAHFNLTIVNPKI